MALLTITLPPHDYKVLIKAVKTLFDEMDMVEVLEGFTYTYRVSNDSLRYLPDDMEVEVHVSQRQDDELVEGYRNIIEFESQLGKTFAGWRSKESHNDTVSEEQLVHHDRSGTPSTLSSSSSTTTNQGGGSKA